MFASDDESDTENESEDVETRDNLKMLGLMSDGRAMVERNIKKVGACDGADPEKTLRWLRALDTIPTPVQIARVTAEGALSDYLETCKSKEWPKLRQKIAENFVSAAFEQTQREALESLTQRSGEPLVKFNHEFSLLLKEAYTELPEDQVGLVRTYLSALNDRRMALRIVEEENPTTLKGAVRAAVRHEKANDLLKPKKQGKVAAIIPEPKLDVARLTEEIQKLVAAQAVTQVQVAELSKPLQNPNPQRKQESNGNSKGKKPIECYRCHKPGHIARNCRTVLANQNSPRVQSPADLNMHCERCHRTNHTTAQCKAGPPPTACRACGDNHWYYDCPQKITNQPQQNEPKN